MNESKASRYQRARRRAEASAVVAGGLTLSALALTPAAVWLRDFSSRLVVDFPAGLRSTAALLVFVFLVTVIWEVTALPIALRRSRSRSRNAEVNVDQVLLAHLQAGVIGFVAAFVTATIIVVSALAGPAWWIVAAALLAILWALLLRAGPAALVQLATVRPIRRPVLRERLDALVSEVRVPVAGIHEWVVSEDATATAMVTGVGRAKHVFVSSTLVREWDDDEIAVVVAHELAHHAHHDLWRSFGLNVLLLASGLGLAAVVLRMGGPFLGLSGPGDFATLPLVALVAAAVWALATPVRYAQSRAQERHADLFALRATGAVRPFQTAIKRLGARHLAEERPSRLTQWLHHRHPSVAERLALAEELKGGGLERA
jgi:STE24 endopeptidase